MYEHLTPKELPDLEMAHQRILDIGIQVKTARQLKKFDCPQGADGCRCCKPFEAILRGEAEFVGSDEYNADVYILTSKPEADEEESIIL